MVLKQTFFGFSENGNLYIVMDYCEGGMCRLAIQCTTWTIGVLALENRAPVLFNAFDSCLLGADR